MAWTGASWPLSGGSLLALDEAWWAGDGDGDGDGEGGGEGEAGSQEARARAGSLGAAQASHGQPCSDDDTRPLRQLDRHAERLQLPVPVLPGLCDAVQLPQHRQGGFCHSSPAQNLDISAAASSPRDLAPLEHGGASMAVAPPCLSPLRHVVAHDDAAAP
ncbi:uncharacterized protein SETTUDRAFT_27820, partial [Exserohilum turcica Et28A]